MFEPSKTCPAFAAPIVPPPRSAQPIVLCHAALGATSLWRLREAVHYLQLPYGKLVFKPWRGDIAPDLMVADQLWRLGHEALSRSYPESTLILQVTAELLCGRVSLYPASYAAQWAKVLQPLIETIDQRRRNQA